MATVAGPIVYTNTGDTNNHELTFPAFNTGDMLVVILQANSGSEHAISGFTEIEAVNSNLLRVMKVLVKIAEAGDTTSKTLTNSFRRTTAHTYVVSGATDSLSEVFSAQHSGTSPDFDPPLVSPTLGLQEYVWFASVASDVTEGFNGGPTDYTSELTPKNGDMSFATAYRVLTADAEDPSPFTSLGSSPSTTFTVAVAAQAATTPNLRKGSQFTVETTLAGTVTSATLNGAAITVDSHVGTTVTLTDSDGSITTSGEYALVLTDDAAATETITVQVNVYGVAPSNNPLQKDGAALASLTDVEVRVSAGANLSGSELYYSGTAITDASGNLDNIDLSSTAAADADPVLLSIRTAAGDSIVASETVGII